MIPRTIFLGIALLVIPQLYSGEEGIVTLRNKTLSIRELVEEAGHQTSVEITIDLKEDDGPTLPYDCQSTLRQILNGVRGYFLHQTGLELLETWDGENKVHLHFKAMRTEIIAVQVEGREPVPTPKRVEKKEDKNSFFRNLFGRKGPGVREQRKSEEPMEETSVKHLELGEEELTPEDHPLEEVPETVPTRLKVEALNKKSFEMSPEVEAESTKTTSPLSSEAKVGEAKAEAKYINVPNAKLATPDLDDLKDLEPLEATELQIVEKAEPKAKKKEITQDKVSPVDSLPDL
jgi:hypothetical protein